MLTKHAHMDIKLSTDILYRAEVKSRTSSIANLFDLFKRAISFLNGIFNKVQMITNVSILEQLVQL